MPRATPCSLAPFSPNVHVAVLTTVNCVLVGIGMTIESDFYATDAGRQQCAAARHPLQPRSPARARAGPTAPSLTRARCLCAQLPRPAHCKNRAR